MLRYEIPSVRRMSDILDYRREIMLSDKNFDGCAGLGNFQTIEQWLKRLSMMSPKKCARGYYPTIVYLAYDGNTLAGMVNIRLSDDDFLRRFAGHIGYNVRPSMRKRGIAAEMLRSAVGICTEHGINEPVVCTEAVNTASQRTALACGFRSDGEETLDTGEKVLRFVYSVNPVKFKNPIK